MQNDPFTCKHKWRTKALEGAHQDGTVACNDCGLTLTNANKLQLDMNMHAVGFQKRISLITIFISITALLVSIAGAICK